MFNIKEEINTKVYVNLPQTPEEKKELAKRVAEFHATLMLEKIKKLNISDASKEKVLNLVLDYLQEEAKKECI